MFNNFFSYFCNSIKLINAYGQGRFNADCCRVVQCTGNKNAIFKEFSGDPGALVSLLINSRPISRPLPRASLRMEYLLAIRWSFGSK
jgi:hypothetical protein